MPAVGFARDEELVLLERWEHSVKLRQRSVQVLRHFIFVGHLQICNAIIMPSCVRACARACVTVHSCSALVGKGRVASSSHEDRAEILKSVLRSSAAIYNFKTHIHSQQCPSNFN